MIFRSRSTTAASPSLDPTMQALRHAAIDAQRSRLPQMAAALSYRTVFGLLPVAAIGLWILHKLIKPDDLKMYVGKGLDLLGLSTITIDPSAAQSGPPAPGSGSSLAETESLQNWITQVVENVNKISFDTIGLVGLFMLIYAAVSMVVEIERAFNQIFRVPRGRSWSRRIINYWTLLTLGALGLFATFLVQQKLSAFVTQWSQGRTGLGSGVLTLTLLGLATQIMISTAVLLLLYMAVPNTRVKFTAALRGALLAAAMFECSKFAFGKYVEFSAGRSYARLYGSLALIPLFLLWVYFTWLIVLFGVQLTCHLQYGRNKTRALPLAEFAPTLVDPTSVLAVMRTIGTAFGAGLTLDAPAISQQTRVVDPVVRLILGKLCERGLLHRLESAAAAGAEASLEASYALARPPAAIAIADLVRIGQELSRSSGAGDDADPDPLFLRLRQAEIDAAGHETLATLVPTPDQIKDLSPSRESEAIARALMRAEPTKGRVQTSAEPTPPLQTDRPSVPVRGAGGGTA